MKIQFSNGFESASLDFQNGEFHRSFNREEEPFEVTDEEWAILRRTKYFELFTEPPPPPPPADDPSQQEQHDQSQAGSPKRGRKAQDNKQSEEK